MYLFNKDLILKSVSKVEGSANIFLGGLPLRLIFTTLSGTSDDYSIAQFGDGAFTDQGNLIIAGTPPSGIIHIIDLKTYEVVNIIQYPRLKSYNITSASK